MARSIQSDSARTRDLLEEVRQGDRGKLGCSCSVITTTCGRS